MNLIDKDAVVATIKKHVEEERHSYFCKCLLSEIDALKVKEQPQLPSNLDEAEFEYAQSLDEIPANQEEEKMIYDAFKAGAEWRDAQIQKLPNNLDEVAEEYIKFKPRYDIQQELEEGEDPTEIECFTIDAAIDSFKAGAEWMAGQGETQQHFVIGSIADSPCGPAVVCYTEEFSVGDEVIVQIRKK